MAETGVGFITHLVWCGTWTPWLKSSCPLLSPLFTAKLYISKLDCPVGAYTVVAYTVNANFRCSGAYTVDAYTVDAYTACAYTVDAYTIGAYTVNAYTVRTYSFFAFRGYRVLT